MPVRPFRLVGSSTIAALHTIVDSALGQWSEAWGVHADAAHVCCARAFESAGSGQGVRQSRRAGERCLWLGWKGDAAAELQRLLCPPATHEFQHGPVGPRLAPALAQGAFEALLAELAKALLPGADAPSEAASEVPSAQFARGAGSVTVELRIGKLPLRCVLNAAAVEALRASAAREAEPRPPKLARIRLLHALRDIPVRLKVEAGSVTVGAGSLLTSGAGDVIRLDSSADGPMVLRAPDGEVVLHAFLGRLSGTVAVEIAQGPINLNGTLHA